jgi:hypothetical protein
MARHGKMEFIPATVATGIIPMDQIPQDVKDDFEGAWKEMQKSEGRMRVSFDTKAEALKWTREMASYAANRPGGALRFRRSPTKGLPDEVVDFRITADLEANAKRKAGTDAKSDGKADAANK